MEAIISYPNEELIEYLNTLHNVSANNQSAITELSITNPFFAQTMVEREVGHSIVKSFNSDPAHIFILTGHAGDGKTGLLYQVLRAWNAIQPVSNLELSGLVSTPSGQQVRYVKDFSELESSQREKCLNRAKDDINRGVSTFLVANTGPLINSFDKCFSEEAEALLIDSIDGNDGALKYYDGIPISVINVATIDNSTFVEPFLTKLLSNQLWTNCQSCSKKDDCPILMNRRLMEQSSSRVIDFITKHYIFQQEYGEKLTIRQIVAHLGFTLTGGLTCKRVKSTESIKFDYLFSNSFFGYKGIKLNRSALSMKAIGDIVRVAYDSKRMRADEALFIKNDIPSLFTQEVADLLIQSGLREHQSEEWQRAVRRAYMFLNIDTNETSRKNMMYDVFSPWFYRYIQLRGGASVTTGDKALIQDALQMLFTDSILGEEKEIPITMKRENGVAQSVQIVYDSIPKKKIRLLQEPAIDYSNVKRYRLFMAANGQRIDTCISLPLFDYFEEIRRGAISTDIDPMLSQGIDSLKAQIVSFCESDRSEIELLTLSNSGWSSVTAEYDSGDWIIG